MSSKPETPIQEELVAASDHGFLEKLLSFFGSDYRQCHPDELDDLMHNAGMALPNETVQMGFVCGRDKVVLTTHRAMKIDTQGFTGNKVLWLSLPYSKIRYYDWRVRALGILMRR